MTDNFKRPCVWWTQNGVALHWSERGERVGKKTLMLELPRTDENEALLVAMANAGRALLQLPLQSTSAQVRARKAVV